ncbi:MAG: 3-oxoacyl-ACP reductase FabG [Candidatus Symbiothrix sp.]|jgi:3-oxoacyl-[acyl-carrier protein] reductase|nr:3-oxoacyl-ACP reductase FabG [Candidatus Symbiothrix sp.]
MDLHLKNKVILVTGGSRGIGRAICEAFAAEGALVAFNYVNSQEKAEALSAYLQDKYGTKALNVKADMSKESEISAMITQVEQTLGAIDVLVNNAAVCPSGPITSYSTETWNETFAVNVTGMFIASREVVSRLLQQQKGGAIVNIASQAAFRGSTTGHLPYDSSKGAMVSFTIGLAREVSAKGIRVNAVAPGLVRTEMVAKTWEERKERYLQTIPIQRIAEPQEIADIVVFLASERAGYITGATVDASGGMMMR